MGGRLRSAKVPKGLAVSLKYPTDIPSSALCVRRFYRPAKLSRAEVTVKTVSVEKVAKRLTICTVCVLSRVYVLYCRCCVACVDGDRCDGLAVCVYLSLGTQRALWDLLYRVFRSHGWSAAETK